MRKKLLLKIFTMIGRKLDKKGVNFFLFMESENNSKKNVFTSFNLERKHIDVILGEIEIQIRTVNELERGDYGR